MFFVRAGYQLNVKQWENCGKPYCRHVNMPHATTSVPQVKLAPYLPEGAFVDILEIYFKKVGELFAALKARQGENTSDGDGEQKKLQEHQMNHENHR